MDHCKICGEKLTQDGRCIACLEKIKQHKTKRASKKKLIIGIAIGVAALICAAILWVLLSAKETPQHPTTEQRPLQFAAEDYDQVGTCGENVQWGFKEETGELTIIGTGAMEDYTGTMPPWDSLEIRSVAIYGVTTIGASAFSYCDSLTSVCIDDSVTTIGDSAFQNCTNLADIILGDGIKSIGTGAFSFCNITEIILPDSVTSLGKYVFSDCHKLTSVIIPDYVSSLGNYAFSSCSNLETVTIGNGLNTIEECVFMYCENLREVTIGSRVTHIVSGSFFGCSSLADIHYSGSEKDWQRIRIDNSDELSSAAIHYNS